MRSLHVLQIEQRTTRQSRFNPIFCLSLSPVGRCTLDRGMLCIIAVPVNNSNGQR